MRALALIGEDAAATKYVEFDGEPAIVIRRFDRINSADGSVLRVHTEDLAQAHAVMPERKYESDRGPGVQIIANTLRSAAGDSTVAKFARGVIANYLLAAPDAHSKNYSLLLAGRNVELAPLYDVATGLAGDPETGALRWRKSAMSIGGENRFGEVVGKNWAKFAAILGMDNSLIVDYVKEMSSTIPDAFGQAIRELPPNTPGIDLAKKLILPRLSSFTAHVHKQSDRTEHARRTRTTFFDTLQAPTPAQPESAQSSAPPDKSR
jgi:serine/threonine-protein kinase HipA